MSSLVENFIRRIEKIVASRASIPTPGTNHVDDNWLNTDIYPGELAVDLSSGSLFSSDGIVIIDLNRENLILDGLVLEKDTSGVNKLSITSGSVRINGKTYIHLSSGTDLVLPPNLGVDLVIYFVYGETSLVNYGSGASGDYTLNLSYTSLSGSNNYAGLFSTVAFNDNIPAAPTDSILLGTVLMYPGSTGYDLFPLSVANIGDYYPRFSVTPSEFCRTRINEVQRYQYNLLVFPGQFVIDQVSDTIYLAKTLFVSDSTNINNDISYGNLASISGGGSGGTGSYSSISIGLGAEIYKTTVGDQFQFRSLLYNSPIEVSQDADTITIGLSMSGFVTELINVGTGATIYSGMSGTSAMLRSLINGSNVSLSTIGDEIVIDVPVIGSTAQGINLGSPAIGLNVFAGMSGADLTFKKLFFGIGLSAVSNSDLISISFDGRNNNGINTGGGAGLIYGGMSGDNLIFRSLTAGSNISISTVGNLIYISASGSTAGGSGINIGSTGSTVGQLFYGMSGSDLLFNSLTTGYGLAISQVGNDIQIDATIIDGAQGPQGYTGPQGISITGFQGPQGDTGAQGIGVSGSQGPQGYIGPQGFGITGSQGPAGINAGVSNQKYIDIYDNSGGATVTTSNYRYMSFNVYPERANTDTALFIPGTASQIAPDGNYIEIEENGGYLFIYTVTLQVPSLAYGTAYLYNYSTLTKVDGSDIWFSSKGGVEVITSTGKVAIPDVQAGTRFAIVITSGNGTLSTVADASSFYIERMEIGQGPTGPQGAGSSPIYYQNSCPIDPIGVGTFWYNNVTGKLAVYVYDDESSQYVWVTPTSTQCSPSFFYTDRCPAVTNILPGSLWYHSETGVLSVYILDTFTQIYRWVTPSIECCPGMTIEVVADEVYGSTDIRLSLIITNGIPPYTYNWKSITAGNGKNWVILGSNDLDTAVFSMGVERGFIYVTLIEVTVTDYRGVVGKTTFLLNGIDDKDSGDSPNMP